MAAAYIAAVALVTALALWLLPRRLALRVSTVAILSQLGLALLAIVLLLTGPKTRRSGQDCPDTHSLFYEMAGWIAVVMFGLTVVAVTASFICYMRRDATAERLIAAATTVVSMLFVGFVLAAGAACGGS